MEDISSQSQAFYSMIYSLPYLLLLIGTTRVNLPREQRARQFILPIIAIIYCFILMTGIDVIEAKLAQEIEGNPVLYKIIAQNVEDTLKARMIFVLNAVFAFAFLFIKFLLLPMINRLCSDDIVQSFARIKCNELYIRSTHEIDVRSASSHEDDEEDSQGGNSGGQTAEYDASNDDDNRARQKSSYFNEAVNSPGHGVRGGSPEVGVGAYLPANSAAGGGRPRHKKNSFHAKAAPKQTTWYLNPKKFLYQGLFRTFYWTFFVVSSLLFLISCIYPEWPIFKSIYYPVFGLIILGEAMCYLGGIEAKPSKKKIEPFAEEIAINPNFEAYYKDVRELFADRLIANKQKGQEDDERIIKPAIAWSYSNDYLEKLCQSELTCEQIVGNHFAALESHDHTLDINYVQTSLLLMQGKSTIFYNPFYRDLTDYIVLPMIRQLIEHKTCLVIVGRNSAAADVCQWLREAASDFAGTNGLWRVERIAPGMSVPDIGVLQFSDIYNLDIMSKYAAFFKNVGMIFIIEPSRILATGQMALSLLAERCTSDDKSIIYSACDRNCDGLVDALSHTLRTNLTNVTATLQSKAKQLYDIIWAADGPIMHHKLLHDVSRYLGVGTELNVTALKHHIRPVIWMSGDTFPSIDMKWIDGQYFGQICPAASLETSQAAFDSVFHVNPNFWSITAQNEPNFVIEDEFRNLAEMSRVFETRALNTGCINIISEHYLLRDYMAANIQTMLADPKAIPTIVPDFARTERNIVLKLIMMMHGTALDESVVEHELRLAGRDKSSFDREFRIQAERSKEIKSPKHSMEIQSIRENFRLLIEKYCNVKSELKDQIRYETIQGSELDAFAKKLKSAYFIAEDEAEDRHHIGAILYDHVYQAYLPGQFLTSEGKYYQVQTITAENGVVVRRAADHIQDREYYRQMRTIHISKWHKDTTMGSSIVMTQTYDAGGCQIELIRGYADFQVETLGYLKLNEPDDLKHAIHVEVKGIPVRSYTNKGVLRVKMTGISEQVRYAICLLLQEIFKTVYPQSWPYISAVTPLKNPPTDYMQWALYHAIYHDGADICDMDAHENSSYIDFIEDSDLDLGLIVSIERNLTRFLEIACEILMWHQDRLIEISHMTPPQAPQKEEPESIQTQEPPKKPETFWQRIKRKLGFGPAKETEEERQAKSAAREKAAQQRARQREEKYLQEKTAYTRTVWYKDNGYLHFGDTGYPDVFGDKNIQETIDCLTGYGFDRNPLHAVRIAKEKDRRKTADAEREITP